jgi:hypothetical protein
MVHSCELVSSAVVKQFDKQGDCLQRGSMSVVGLANAGRDDSELAQRWQCCCTSLLCDADA